MAMTSCCQDSYQKAVGWKGLIQLRAELMVQNHDLVMLNQQYENLDTQGIAHLGLLHLYHKDQVAFNQNSKIIKLLYPNKILMYIKM
jgi:hypothetical protein